MNPDWHENGYPPQHAIEIRDAWRYLKHAMLLTGIPFVLLALGTVFGPVPAMATALSAAIVIYAFCGSLGGLNGVYYHAQVHPYFERELGDIDTFLAGKTIIKYLNQLDAIAQALGVRPLSTFGFKDDLRGQSLVWHPPHEGLKTVKALQQRIKELDIPAALRSTIGSDLLKWQQAFECAENEGVRFCLLLRHCNVTSGHEWAVRKGSAF